jgi:hypothetical protein
MKAKKDKCRKTWRPGKRTVVIYIILVIIGLTGIVLYISSGRPAITNMESSNAENIISINNVIAQQYETVIYPEGKSKIDSELVKLRAIPDPKERLNEIFVWEMKDWIDLNTNLSRFACVNQVCTYAVLTEDPARIKASPYYDGVLYPQINPNGTLYAEDPYWIAYNMIGECREYATLFSFMAEQSGIDSRIVRTNTHQWVEVQLDHESYYYDPWCADVHGYYDANDGNMTYQDKWFNRIGYFEDNCHPPDGYLISYNGFPWVWATPKYFMSRLGTVL